MESPQKQISELDCEGVSRLGLPLWEDSCAWPYNNAKDEVFYAEISRILLPDWRHSVISSQLHTCSCASAAVVDHTLKLCVKKSPSSSHCFCQGISPSKERSNGLPHFRDMAVLVKITLYFRQWPKACIWITHSHTSNGSK